MRRIGAAAKFFSECSRCVMETSRRRVRALVGVGEHDDLDQAPEVVAGRDELLGEEVEGRGVAQLVVVREVVERFDEAVADEFGPDAVDEGAGEVAVARVGDELGELVAQLAGAVDVVEDVELPALLLGLLEDRVGLGGRPLVSTESSRASSEAAFVPGHRQPRSCGLRFSSKRAM